MRMSIIGFGLKPDEIFLWILQAPTNAPGPSTSGLASISSASSMLASMFTKTVDQWLNVIYTLSKYTPFALCCFFNRVRVMTPTLCDKLSNLHKLISRF
ncbi:hypothetical protein ACJRO7_032606 [Eucalyptus globulus]|uniref:Uncharacterized protein n=1 Tax=Eucalyptus globulus TaxID=34317 RepID=A0ABD3JKF0_EUCGL